MLRLSGVISLTLGSVAGLTLHAAPARACGGFFCDTVNNMPIPVDQTGENIIFAIDEQAETVEAHIQIQYTGDPVKFGWIIPVTAEPDFAIGSELLFTNLLNATVPVYSVSFESDCQDNDRDMSGCVRGDAKFSADSGVTFGTGAATGGGTEGDFEVVKREIVGAYQIVVLKGGTAQEVWDWLAAAGYYQDPDAPPIMQKYLDEGYYFAAAKLLHGAGIEELQPIVMTYSGTTPCVPLRLTAIAAQPDMGVRVFGFGANRYAPSNYRHVEINDVRLDWTTNADNYLEVVGRAIDAEGSDGRGFVTEYAGQSSIVPRAGIYSPSWNSDTFVGAAPFNNGLSIVDVLETQGLVDCTNVSPCSYLHPQILPLLRTYLPAPPGVPEDLFYGEMESYMDDVDLMAWNGDAFAADMKERIIDPGLRAIALLDKFHYLTRLLTIISPEEMTVDPEFIENPELEDVDFQRQARQQTPCSGSDRVLMPDGRGVLLQPSNQWPEFIEAMPWARRVEQMAPAGAPQVIQDFDPDIVAALKASNARYDYDNGSGVSCAVGRNSWSAALGLGVILGFAWWGRRRRA